MKLSYLIAGTIIVVVAIVSTTIIIIFGHGAEAAFVPGLLLTILPLLVTQFRTVEKLDTTHASVEDVKKTVNKMANGGTK